MRLLLFIALLLVPALVVFAEQPEEIPTGNVTSGRSLLLRAEYPRELWVGVPPADVTAVAMLSALREACDDTTSVAVLDIELKAGVAATPEERLAVRTVAARAALHDLKEAAAFDKRITRLVLVGVMDSCRLAARLASEEAADVEGLALIDPPVGDVSVAHEGLPRVGVDVLLHPRSDAEWESEQEWTVSRLEEWGRNARVIRSRGHFDSLAERIAELRTHTRGYTVLEDGEASSFTARQLATRLNEFDVVMVGELHGNPGAHRVQLEMLRYFAGGGRKLALSTEQFERDVQPVLDRYLAGEVDEGEFLRNSRPWPNYADYRPLIELCRTAEIPVIAGNIPRRLASRVFRESPGVIDDFSEEERAWTARELRANPGSYRDKFMRTMGGVDGHSDRLENMYAAQCIKDDTMAESIADWLALNEGARVLHINGNFHSAGGLGVPEKLAALNPELKVALITCVAAGTEAEPTADEWIITIPAPRPSR